MSSSQVYSKQQQGSIFILIAMLMLFAAFSGVTQAREFTHPSILSSTVQLNNLANDRCNSKKAALELMMGNEHASLSRNHNAYHTVFVESYTGNKYEEAFRGDAHAARALAIMWVVTDDSRYLNKAKTILSDWADTFQEIKVTKGAEDQAYLEASWALPIWIGAADIINYYNNGAADWSESEKVNFRKFVEKVGEYASKAYKRSNWGASSVLSELALAVYLEDDRRFNQAIRKYKQNLSDLSTDSGILTADYLRDTWHPQYTLSAWVQTAEIAWHNNVDLYALSFEDNSPRLLKVLNHFSKLFNGELPSPKGLKKGSYKNSHMKRSGYFQIAYNHYVLRKQTILGNSSLIKAHQSWFPGAYAEHFMSWDSLTHFVCGVDKRSGG